MVIKTETCFFSETKIYPGHGTQFVRKDGKLLHFQNSKIAALHHQGKKAMRLTWSMAWRRINKKVRVEVISKRRAKRRVRIQKGVAGQTLDDIRKKRAAKPVIRNLQKEAQIRAVKERKAKAAAAPKAAKQPKLPQQKPKFSKKGTR